MVVAQRGSPSKHTTKLLDLAGFRTPVSTSLAPPESEGKVNASAWVRFTREEEGDVRLEVE